MIFELVSLTLIGKLWGNFDPENENIRKISGWVFHDLPIRVHFDLGSFFEWTYDMYLNNRYYDNNYFKRVCISNTEYQTIYFS